MIPTALPGGTTSVTSGRAGSVSSVMNDASAVNIVSGTTRYFEGSSHVFKQTQYHKHDRLDGVPARAEVGCDWPYAVRRYNGSGVNSFWYQAELARYFWSELSPRLAGSRAEHLSVEVAETPGQSCRYFSPLPRTEERAQP